MLEQMRRNSRSLLIWLLFGIIIVVFVISFGPQSRGATCDQTMSDDQYAAKVGRQVITNSDFRYGFMLRGGDRAPPKVAKQARLKEQVMDKLIERELLTAMAEKLGFVVTDDEVDDQIADAKILALGELHTVPMLQKEGRFNYESFKNFVRVQLQQTPAAFVEEQKKELLASRVRNLVRSSVTVSADEAKAEFIRKNRQLNLEYMRFTSRRFETEVALTDQEITAFAAKNEAKLKEIYEQKKFLYEKAPAQRRIRQILVKLPHDADEKADKAAREKAEALAEKLKRGAKSTGKDGLTFAELARQASEDTVTKARGGDLGWRARGGTNLQGAAEDKVFEAKNGAIVGPVKGNDGYLIVKVEGSREGHIPFENAKAELAEEKLRQEQGNARAKAAAEAALAKAKETPTSTLKTSFPPPSDTEEASADTASSPRVEETGLFALRATPEGVVIEGIGVSNPLAKAAFALTAEKPLAGPFSIGDNFIIVRLKERKEPDLAEFERRKLELVREAEMAKGERVLSDWTRAACVEAKNAKRISVNLDVLKYNEEGPAEQSSYEPCADADHRLFGG
jgi:peptidyl-prolyl cis-trans isomerase D